MLDKLTAPQPNQALLDVQREVQRKLGRCMVRVQQFEKLMKAMLASMAAEGAMEQTELGKEKVACDLNGKSLGHLLQEYFFADYLVDAATRRDMSESATEKKALAAGLPYFKYRYQIQMEPAVLESTKNALVKFRDLRNELVHHLIDKFNIDDELSCQAAVAYLDESFETIDRHFMQLKEWALGMEKTRELQVAFMQSKTFIDLLDNGINPDGTVDWPASGVVQALREAEIACALNGWTLLDTAIAWLPSDYSDQTPAKYQCRTWRQILKRSGQFEVKTITNEVGGKGHTLFRSKINPPPTQYAHPAPKPQLH
jgi:hypothetical protein